MKQAWKLIQLTAAVAVTGLLGGCGSGGDGAAGVATGSVSGSASASGTITDFGSVYVNGKRFDTSRASFTVDGETGKSQSDLKRGMVVTVAGSFNGDQRTANSVRQQDAVEGLVQSVAADGLSLVVMGQTVLVDSATLIDNNIPGQNIRNLVPGTDQVEVNGHIRAGGIIQATFIERKLLGVTPEVRGYISDHLSGAATFRIGSLTVNYSGALINDMPVPNGSNWNTLFVEVKGTTFNPATSSLLATEVEPENQGAGNNTVDEFEVEGFVDRVAGLGDFFIGTTHVQTTASTEFRGGTIDEIVMGAKVSAEGRLANGILTATHVKFHESVRLAGTIASINAGTNTFAITGLSGVTVTVNSQTAFSANGGGTITGLNDLSVGGHVRVRGRLGNSTTVIATRVEQRPADDDVDLQGPVQAVSNPNLTILGVSANTAGISENDFKGLNDAPIGRAAFFNGVRVGTLVKVKGRLVAGSVTWREVELED